MVNDPQTATERVGRYQLLEPLGAGPNGSVARAKVFGVAGFERQFALKRFLPELTVLSTMAQSLSAAARSYGSLEHPRIARMTEFGVAQGTTFTAVELVTGLDAMRLGSEAKANGATLASGGVLALISQAARAVGYAHGRGLTHLGLAPTNIIITPDGDVKVTDFGILAATMPARPVETGRLANRIGYFAPEQLASEGTSAATDVFVLGVIAYELVTGTRAFRGDTPQQVAQAILTGPPPDPSLPRPIVRVLQRCLARSQFERFPDARALADALDAALRVAPVPGTRKDVGAQVKGMLDRLASLNENQLSGVVSLNMGTGPIRPVEQAPLTPAREIPRIVSSLGRSDPAPSPGATLPELPKPMTTVAGVAPPPIPVPPGISGPPSSPAPGPNTAPTMLGMPPAKRQQAGVPPVIPPIKPRANGPAAVPPPTPPPRAPTPPPIPRELRLDTDVVPVIEGAPSDSERNATIPELKQLPRPVPEPEEDIFHSVTREGGAIQLPKPDSGPTRTPTVPERNATQPTGDRIDTLADSSTTLTGVEPARAQSPVLREPRAQSPRPVELATAEMSPELVKQLERATQLPTGEVPALVSDGAPQNPLAGFAEELDVPTLAHLPPSKVRTGSEHVPPIAIPSAIPSAQRPQEVPVSASTAVPVKNRRWPLVLGIGLVVIAAAAGAFVLFGDDILGTGAKPTKGKGSSQIAMKGTDVGSDVKPVATGSDMAGSGTKPAAGSDAKPAAGSDTKPAAGSDAKPAAGSDAKPAAGSNAGSNAKPPEPVGASDSLQITSTPAGARVFIDGADQGTTPVKLAGSADRHTVALLLAGHDLYVAEVDGHGVFKLELKPVTPSGGPAGIKVIKCAAKDRYYVFVDGKPTGMTCPTERIECAIGQHTVEVYDVVTETRRKWDINVTDTRLSYRVRIE